MRRALSLGPLGARCETAFTLRIESQEPRPKTDPSSVLFEIGLCAALMLLIGLLSELAVRFG
jgi:hypothetical protein